MKLTIASWNILNDYWALHGKGYDLQADRLDTIIAEIKALHRRNPRLVLFLCEAEEQNVAKITQETGLVMLNEPETYTSLAVVFPRDYAAQTLVFLADAETAKQARVERLRTKKHQRNAMLRLTLNGKKIIGTHLAQRVALNYGSRRSHLARILAEKPDIFMGDFNATPLFPLRLGLKRTAYVETHKASRPPFPSPQFRGKNIHWWLPDINIDALYHALDFPAHGSGYSLNEGSDHPLIWTEFTV